MQLSVCCVRQEVSELANEWNCTTRRVTLHAERLVQQRHQVTHHTCGQSWSNSTVTAGLLAAFTDVALCVSLSV